MECLWLLKRQIKLKQEMIKSAKHPRVVTVTNLDQKMPLWNQMKTFLVPDKSKIFTVKREMTGL